MPWNVKHCCSTLLKSAGLVVLLSGVACTQTRECTFAVSPAALFFDGAAQTSRVGVTASQPNCPWSARSDAAWLTVTSGSSGRGNGTLPISLAANSSKEQRGAALTVAQQTVTITQRHTQRFFEDVPPQEVFFDSVNLMRRKSITAGCSIDPPLFCPQDSVTLGQMAVFFVRMVIGGGDFSFPPAAFFDDVPATHQFFKWVQKMRELGITQGCSPVKFCPDEPVTRGNLAMFLVRARLGGAGDVDYPERPLFNDVPSTHAFFRWIQQVKQLGMNVGCSETEFCPDELVTRGQMAMLLMRSRVE